MSQLKVGLCPALTEEVLMSLRAKGLQKAVDFLARDVEDTAQLTGLSYKDLMSIRKVILAKYASLPVSGGALYTSSLSSLAILSTGCQSCDELLDGGLYAGEVTEIVGEVAGGKTQLCFSTCATTARDSKKNVLYIDTCNGFSAQRIANMIGDMSEVEGALARIHCVNVFNADELLEQLDMFHDKLLDQTDPLYQNLKLLVIDSIASVIYPILGNSHSEGQGLICLLGQKLKCLAVEFSLAVLVTNNTVGGEGGIKTAGLGRAWSHMAHTRLMLHLPSPLDCNRRQVQLVKSSRLATHSEKEFDLAGLGITIQG